MRKYIFLFFAVFFLAVMIVNAADKSADEILKQVKDIYQKNTNICADFTQKFIWKLTEEEHVLSGTICVQKGVKFKIETPDNVIVNDGEALWTLNRTNNQVIVNNGSQDSEGAPFLKQFIDKFIRDYTAVLEAEEKEYYLLKLTAKSEDEFIREVQLQVDKKSYFLLNVIQHDANENTTDYKVDNIRTDVSLTADYFKIKDIEQYEVVDLR
ncbi:outer membrane lipoprotein carrier protein LolA [candidate division KSB1 bacterium]|nr:outer membrane lipoprotein carrier protein LolA [candidate division KSB1 bacterium]